MGAARKTIVIVGAGPEYQKWYSSIKLKL